MNDFDNAFSNEPEQQEEAQAQEVEQTQEAQGETAEKEGETASPEGETNQAEPAPEKSEEKDWQYAAYKDEKHKRQELEKQVAMMQGQMQAFQQHQQPEQHQQANFYEDPEGFINHQAQNIQTQMKEALFAQSEEMMRMQTPDYDEKREQFLTLAQQNPSLRDQVLNHPAPGAFIYNTVKQHEQQQQLSQIGDLDKWKAEQKELLRKELEAEAKKRGQQILSEPSLADARGVKGGEALSGGDVFDQTFS